MSESISAPQITLESSRTKKKIVDKQHAFDGVKEKSGHVRKGDNASERAISYLTSQLINY